MEDERKIIMQFSCGSTWSRLGPHTASLAPIARQVYLPPAPLAGPAEPYPCRHGVQSIPAAQDFLRRHRHGRRSARRDRIVGGMGDIRGLSETVKAVQPVDATKSYRCPGCQGVIHAGVFHVVVIPDEQPNLRRHWHTGCWSKEITRHGPAAGIPD